jgi:(1->4)-alpha-D-glucan 1-alpha-D-glucosylmutase
MEGTNESIHALARSLVDEVRAELQRRPTPLATYRLQLNRDFTFEHARKLVPYLARLGVTDAYTSPYLKAAPGSTHGYDVVDHRSVNPEIGSEAEHARFCEALQQAGLGHVLDVVPNHMGIAEGNALWNDVLENGPASMFARFFDIDWAPVKDELADKVLLPILGDQYGVVLENGELQLTFENGAFFLRYFENLLPVAPRQYATVLKGGLDELEKELGSEDLDLLELQSIITAIDHLPLRTETERARRVERHREKEIIKRRLGAVVERNGRVKAFVLRNLERLNGKKGDPRSFDALDTLLAHCSYRLAHWRVAGEEINYRRFFDINTLAAIRMEDPEVFQEAHAKVLEWIAEGKVTGLRIDHPDGLFDPTAYFLDLQEAFFLIRARARAATVESAPAWEELEPILRTRFREEAMNDGASPLRRGLFVVVEKIQGGRERIPEGWAVHGTTGYRFANTVLGLLMDRGHEADMTELYHRFIGGPVDYHELVYQKKKLIVSASMASEVNMLARELNRISEMNRRTRDFTWSSLRRALIELIALFPVYRTYVDGWRPEVDSRDIHYVEWTLARARHRDPTTNATIFEFLRDVLLRRYPAHVGHEERQVMLRFAMRLQQLTGPVMAKGLEDTVFYVYNRLAALNEVGGEPERFGTSVEWFHLRNQERAQAWPAALLATATHDTKRGEDMRARLAVLSELPRAWGEAVERWSALNASRRTQLAELKAPSRNDEYLFYQTVIGALPMGERFTREELESFGVRVREYMLKAIREAKTHTSWINPDADYEAAMARFVDSALAPGSNFLGDALAFKRKIERPGQLNSLTQTLLKLASPGTADIYQGTELWDLALVDPDNRRPVDYARRIELLGMLESAGERDRMGLCKELLANLDDGRLKLYLLHRGLQLRRQFGQLFREADYLPLSLHGQRERHAVAFARVSPAGAEKGLVVALAPRGVTGMIGPDGNVSAAFAGTRVVWPEELGVGPLVDALTGVARSPVKSGDGWVLDLQEIFSVLPVALLYK